MGSLTMLALLTTLLSLALLAEANIDGLVCTDTSYYGEVEYIDDKLSCCETNLDKPDCVTTIERACVNVTESVCVADVTSECEQVECPVNLVRVDIVEKIYVAKKCETQAKQITHTKTRQVPKTVTKKLCNTLWKIGADGEKVWAGEDQCQEVEWQVFEAEEYDAVLNTTEVVCTDDRDIPYSSCEQIEEISKQQCFNCKAVARPLCEFVTTEKCDTTEVKNCKPKVSEPDCNPGAGKTPTQKLNHQEKCLFDESGKVAGNTELEDEEKRHHHHHHQ